MLFLSHKYFTTEGRETSQSGTEHFGLRAFLTCADIACRILRHHSYIFATEARKTQKNIRVKSVHLWLFKLPKALKIFATKTRRHKTFLLARVSKACGISMSYFRHHSYIFATEARKTQKNIHVKSVHLWLFKLPKALKIFTTRDTEAQNILARARF